jgi:hypothetical protein
LAIVLFELTNKSATNHRCAKRNKNASFRFKKTFMQIEISATHHETEKSDNQIASFYGFEIEKLWQDLRKEF